MKILFDNVDFMSSSGPNSFGRKLAATLRDKGHDSGQGIIDPDVQLSFIHMTRRAAFKTALRLDGIYFNSRQDWESLNRPIKESYEACDLVIHQTQFNKRLTERYMGPKARNVVIHNGTDIDGISRIQPIEHPALKDFSEVWCCSSSWRPHKRLKDNIEYFIEMKPEGACLIILGDNPDHMVNRKDVLYAGRQPWETCVSIYKRSKKFIHLAFLDHCPNVVVDARAAGCQLVVASSGGTREVAGPEATVIQDIDWDMIPLDLYSPPPLDFHDYEINAINSDIDINVVADRYIEQLSAL